MRSGSLSPYAIEVREVPALEVATVSAVSDADALEADTTRMVRELAAALETCGIAPRDPVLAILEASPDEVRIPLSVAIALPEERARREALRGSSIAVRTLPAARCAATRHIGPYPELALAHHALFAWAQAQGHDEAGPVREIYVNDPAVVAEDALITDVLLPIR